MRSASLAPMDTVEAPVSTMNCAAWPLMLPWPKKWPPWSAGSTIRPLLALPRPPTLAGESPRRSVSRLPPTSTTAESLLVDTTLTP